MKMIYKYIYYDNSIFTCDMIRLHVTKPGRRDSLGHRKLPKQDVHYSNLSLWTWAGNRDWRSNCWAWRHEKSSTTEQTYSNCAHRPSDTVETARESAKCRRGSPISHAPPLAQCQTQHLLWTRNVPPCLSPANLLSCPCS